MLGKIKNKISKVLLRLRLQPIRVFVFHHVTENFDVVINGSTDDWTQLDVFKKNILNLQQQYTFISLEEAIKHLKEDRIRLAHYAVLTADDGLLSTYELLPWLIQNNIPITLFICPRYLDGHSYPSQDEQRVLALYPNADMEAVAARMYLTQSQLDAIQSSYVTIASHGFSHLNAQAITDEEFTTDVLEAKRALEQHPLYKPYFAYPWGRSDTKKNMLLKQWGLMPVLCDGQRNEHWQGVIHRECIDNLI